MGILILGIALLQKADAVIEEVPGESVTENTCVWRVNETDILRPNPNNHVFLVFTHFLHHFFIKGVGLRQVCDWCRLLWANRDAIDKDLLERRLQETGLMSEWQVFASIAVDALGMPEESKPFYNKRYRRKGKMTLFNVLKTGNLGHYTNQKYRSKFSKPLANTITFFRRMGDIAKFAFIFPADSQKFFFAI